MAWKPVAEVAAAMGVSERTIWRRIKANTIESRNENGRTLVHLDEPDPATDPVRQLSHVAAAQLSMRKLDADTMTDVLAVLKDYRTSFDHEIARARREARWGLATAIVLLVAGAAGVVYHTQKVNHLREDRQTALDTQQARIAVEHQEVLGGLKTRAAEMQAQAEALSSEVETRRRTETDQLAHLASAITAQESVQTTTQECLTDLVSTVAATDQRAGAEIDKLRSEIATLQTQLHDKSLAVEKHQRMAERVAAALGRSAALSNGEAAGLRIYISRLEEQLARLQGTSDSSAADSPAESRRQPTRESILRSLFEQQDGSRPEVGATGDPLWLLGMADDLLRAWLWPTDPLETEGDLVKAGR